ncbi:MAG: hypothetical protein JSU77_08245 [Fidelibacterota bacterium]|nr:MAG: hypothetical protein JSU77_08245 [Candidatus Neomarinimicrobiota bacterium]
MNQIRIYGLIASIFVAQPILSHPLDALDEKPSGVALIEIREQSDAVEDTTQRQPSSTVHVITIEGVISPISAGFILKSIEDAEREQVQCLFFTEIPFLWYNVIGCVAVIAFAYLFNPFFVMKEAVRGAI